MGQRSAHQNRAGGVGPRLLEHKDDSVMDRGKKVLLRDGCVEEMPGLELSDHRSCRRGQVSGLEEPPGTPALLASKMP